MKKKELIKRARVLVVLYKGGKPFFRLFKVFDLFSILNNQGAVMWNDAAHKIFAVTGSNELEDWRLNIKRMLTNFRKTKNTLKGEVGREMLKHLGRKGMEEMISVIPKGVRFHDGFFIGAIRLWAYFLETCSLCKEIELIGHSYGAAVCTILAFLARCYHTSGQRWPCAIVHVQPESSPRVGNKKFAELYNFMLGKITYRIYKDGDIVCKVPWFGYKHVDTGYRLGLLKWWQIISKLFGLPHYHYPDILPNLIEKEMP